MTRVPFAIDVLAFTVLSACGSDGGNDASTSGNLGASCAPDEYALRGTVDGETIAYQGALGSHAWIQASAQSTFDGSFDGGGSLQTEWDGLVADGDTIAIRGSVVFPAGGALGGQQLDAGAGSMTKLDEGLRFEITALSRAVQCITAPCPPEEVEGTVRGCVEWEPFML
jgi:hypothetical protein